jgi:hypothetical protein
VQAPGAFIHEHGKPSLYSCRLRDGAVLVVPLIEKLFWCSFLIRYIIEKDLEKVPLELFTWPSFLLTAVKSGLEHNCIAAGMMAGVLYILIL